MNYLKHILTILNRMKWPLGISILAICLVDTGVISPLSRWALITHKFAVCSLGVIFNQIIWMEMFPYVSLEETLNNGRDIEILGVCCLRGLTFLATVLAICLGL